MGKDLGAIWRNKGTRALLMLLPVTLIVLLPLVYSVAISFLPTEDSLALPQDIAAMVGSMEGYGPRRQWMAAFTTLLCPMLFLCVPIVCSVTAAVRVFVGEKEGGTLETLMLSSVDAKSLLHAKVTCCTLLSMAISLVSFVAFLIVVSVADILMGAPYFFNLEWLVCVVLLMPMVALFSVLFVCWELPRVHSVGEAMQTMGYLMLPPAGSLPGAVYRRVSHHGAAAAGDCRAAGGALHCSIQRHQQAVPARAPVHHLPRELMGRALQNWDASQLSLNAWRELLAESLQNASRFAIHCWNDEEPWIQLALKYGQRRPVPWEGGTVIEGAVTPAFREMLLSLRRPDDRDVYNKFLPFFSLVLDDSFYFEHYGTELTFLPR